MVSIERLLPFNSGYGREALAFERRPSPSIGAIPSLSYEFAKWKYLR